MLANQNLRQWLQLAFSYGVGPATFLKLVRQFGSVDRILSQDLASLAALVGMGVAKSILATTPQDQVANAMAWLELAPTRRRILTLNDAVYPPELAEIASPPVILFAEGNLSLLANPKVAVVGTRHPSQQGLENGYAFGHELALNGVTVVSGLAAGIDRCAHQGALAADAASTIAVLGTGIDLVYPARNVEVYRQISHQGLLLSEFPLGMHAAANNFPRRNRIIVGLAKACLVIESGIDGGSMISANFALEMGREVMALPGSIHNPMARGCHKLIKQGAKLVENINDVLDELQLGVKPLIHKQNILKSEDEILAYFGYEPLTIDELNKKLSLDFGELCGKLLELELTGNIINCGDGRYQRIFK